MARIQDAGVAVIGCFVIGNDGETRASIDRLVEFLLSCRLADIQLTVQTPFPGTALFNRLSRDGRLLGRAWSRHTLFDVVYQPDGMEAHELQEAFHDAVRACVHTRGCCAPIADSAANLAQTTRGAHMRCMTLIGYLLGRREAIHEVATSPMALRVGFVFVIAAGLASEYDQEDLLHEPWHALLPLAASSALAIILGTLFWLMRPAAEQRRPHLLDSWRMFLALFWMIAPMAWLYAIPYEHMLDAGNATRMNLSTLALVASWRLVLMMRILVVTLNLRPVQAFMVVMALADALALFGLSIMPLPLINIMGGIRLSESEQLIAAATMQITFLGVMTLPIWALGAIISTAMGRPDWQILHRDAPKAETMARGGAGWLAGAAVAVGLALLPWTQPEQQRRWRAESLLRSGEMTEAIEFMSRFAPSDFPPHWDPPPRIGYGDTAPNAETVVEAIRETGAAEWVRDAYLKKFDVQLRRAMTGLHRFDQAWPRIATSIVLDDNPRMIATASERAPSLQMLLTMHDRLSSDDHDAIEQIIQRTQPAPIAP